MTVVSQPTSEPLSKVRISKPSLESHKAELDRIDAEIAVLQKQQQDIFTQINGSSKGKGSQPESRGAIIERLKEIRNEQATIKLSKKKVFDLQDQLKASISKLSADIKNSQAKLKYHTNAEIDSQISLLDSKIEKQNLKLVEEKKLISEISNLRRTKKLVSVLETQQQELTTKKAELDEVYNQLRDTNAQALSDEYTVLQQKLDDMKDKFATEKSAIDNLYKQRNELKLQIDKLYDMKRSNIATFKEKSNQFYLWQQEQKKLKYEQEKQSRAQEARERVLSIAKEEQEIAAIPAFEGEINNCTNLLNYLQTTFNQSPAVSSAPSKKDDTDKSVPSNIRQPDADNNVPAGSKILASKQDRGQDFFSGSGASKSKKKSNKSSASKTLSSKQGLRFPLSILDSFNLLKIEPPTNMTNLTTTINAITERKEFFVADQKRATEENKIKAQERIAKIMQEIEQNADSPAEVSPVEEPTLISAE
ncbi:hypothetical protein BB561_000923 [Smittium simulii]|uniref:Nuclear segregation protein Bfr1 n=1 Tax=Smittium simulii TaxID=133385 RepID=A0A2T9YX27_9FUNG|nr:hypothetical protein BB561_000923 [Smittium simulii]